MIKLIRIQGYRKFRDVTISPKPGLNLFVGDNESGKSTLLEAIGLCLTFKVNGTSCTEELNPFWFNQELVQDFFNQRKAGAKVALPTISIEVCFEDDDKLQPLRGVCNSLTPTCDCAGISLTIEPNPSYAAEIEGYLTTTTSVLPVEYYQIVWRSFSDTILLSRPKEVSVAVIDSRTIRSSSGIDYHLRQMLGDNLDASEKTEIAVAYRAVKDEMTEKHLKEVNKSIATIKGSLDGSTIALAMDQSSRASWDKAVVPHLAELPFAMAGQGQQAAVKIALAMGRHSKSTKIVMIEEPENHLSHTSLNKLLSKIELLSGDNQQLFVTTHSSYVLNRLGLDSLLLVSQGKVVPLQSVSSDTVRYFQRLPGHDTLRVALASKLVLVEGPSDEILFERFYRDMFGKRPIEDGVDVISVRGLSFKRSLEVAKLLGKQTAVLRDLDKKTPDALQADYKSLLSEKCKLFVGEAAAGTTLEPQIIAANSEASIRSVLQITDSQAVETWMTANKTESALRIAESAATLSAPAYFSDAITFIHG